jgi:glycosyltransferase involved in cell wall biosynthesis
MPDLVAIAWFFLWATVLTLAAWIVVLVRVWRVAARIPRLRDGIAATLDAGAAPTISVVIPAHNEEGVIDACLRSVRAQDYPHLEIIIVMDRCTDRTADIVAAHASEDDRIVPIVNSSCPDGWAGKCYAIHAGAKRSTGAWILFADADTTFDPRLVRAAFAVAQQRTLNMLSILTTLTFSHRFERMVQPVAGMWLLKMFPIDMVNRAVKPRPFANGQFILVQRDVYERSGGFEAIRNEVVEDIAFARLVSEHGGRGGIVIADGMLRSAMYESFAAFQQGWKRIFIGACKHKPGRLRKYGWRALLAGVGVPILWVLTVVIAFGLIAQGDWEMGVVMIGLVLASYSMQLIALSEAYHLGGVPRSSAIYYPIGSWHTAMIMHRAANDLVARRPVVWGGKQYVLEPR